MKEIKKVSDITVNDLADYLRIVELDEEEINTLNNLLNVAISYIIGYTGHTKEELDNYNDFVIAVFVLVQYMYDNRTMYVDNTNINKVVDTILSMHSVNLL